MRNLCKYKMIVLCLVLCSTSLNAQIKLVDARGTLLDTAIILAGRVKYSDTAAMLSSYLRKLDTIKTSPFYFTGGTTDAGNNKTGAIYRTGYVGINSSIPSYNLDVTGKGRFTDSTFTKTLTATNGAVTAISSSTTNQFMIDPNDSNGPKLKLGNTVNPTAYFEIGAYNSQNNFDTKARDLQFFGTSGNSPGIMMKAATGFVGLGTTAPNSRIEVLHSSLYTDNESVTAGHGFQITSGRTNSDFSLYMGTDKTNLTSYIQSIKWGIATTSLALNGRGGNVGIGTPSPTTTLHISSSLAATNSINANAQILRLSRPTTTSVKYDNIAQFNLGAYAANDMSGSTRLDLAMNDGLSTATSNIMTWTANGRVGIGTTAPDYPIHIYSGAPTSLYVESTTADNGGMLILNANTASNWANNYHEFIMFKNQGTLIGSVTNNGTSGVSFLTTSDERLKENIRPTSFSIAELQKIQIKDFTYKSDKGTHQQTGVLAQQLYKVTPSVVTVGGADAALNPWQVDYGKLTPYLIKAVQDQQQQIEQLEKKSNNQTDQIKEMNLQNQHLVDLINQLEKRIQLLEKK